MRALAVLTLLAACEFPRPALNNKADAAMTGDATFDATFDATLDAADATQTVYNDATQGAHWQTYGIGGTGPMAGGAFDGRYLYMSKGGVVHQYDTQAPFDVSTSWTSFNVIGVNPNVDLSAGAIFDGRYVYFVPLTVVGNECNIVRYDTMQSFTGMGSWQLYDLTDFDSNADGFTGGTFDGRYLYLAPDAYGANVFAVRFDTQAAAMSTAGAWQIHQFLTAGGYSGAVYDGTFVYYIPRGDGYGNNGTFQRFEPAMGWSGAIAWQSYATTAINSSARGFMGGLFDGRYLYAVPFATTVEVGVTVRYDTQQSFGAMASWETFDTTTTDNAAKGFSYGAFDGRYVYFVANQVQSQKLGRYDTMGTFTSASSWTFFSAASLGLGGAVGAIYDGKYLYLAGSTVSRLDTKSPPSMPAAFVTANKGSFY